MAKIYEAIVDLRLIQRDPHSEPLRNAYAYQKNVKLGSALIQTNLNPLWKKIKTMKHESRDVKYG